MSKYRIRKYDSRNWVIEEYIPPAKLKVGKSAGQMSQPRWKVNGYYGKLTQIPLSLLEVYLNGTHEDALSVIKAIKSAEEKCLTAIEELKNVS